MQMPREIKQAISYWETVFFLCFLEKWVSYELLFYKHNKLDKYIFKSNYQNVFNSINVTEAYEIWNEKVQV